MNLFYLKLIILMYIFKYSSCIYIDINIYCNYVVMIIGMFIYFIK